MSEEYWRICVEEALSEVGISVTKEQLETLSDSMAAIKEMECEATGRHLIPNPENAEIATLRRQLKEEREGRDCEVRLYQNAYARKLGYYSARNLSFRIDNGHLEVSEQMR